MGKLNLLHNFMHLSFVSPAPGYPGNSGALFMRVRGVKHADVPASREHVRDCGRGLMVIIWAGNLSWDRVGMSLGRGPGLCQ